MLADMEGRERGSVKGKSCFFDVGAGESEKVCRFSGVLADAGRWINAREDAPL
jgi:hypothetical protein